MNIVSFLIVKIFPPRLPFTGRKINAIIINAASCIVAVPLSGGLEMMYLFYNAL
jgi:hypothetical protein